MTPQATNLLKLLPLGIAMLLLGGCPGPDNPAGPGGGGDITEPTLQITSPTAGATVIADSVIVEGTASDNEQVTRLTYTLNGGGEQQVGITPGRSVPFRFALAAPNGAGSLTLTAHDAANNRASRSVAFTVDACLPTLVSSATAPGSELIVRGVPPRLAQLRGLVRVPGTAQAASVYPERRENGDVALLVPLHPMGSAGGEAELILSDAASACRPVAFRIAPLPPSTGTSDQLLVAFNQVAGTLAAALGAEPARLLEDPATLAPELRPLAMALQLLEGPNNPNSLKALLDGSAPALEGISLDRELAASLLAQSGMPQALQSFQQRIAALGPPPTRGAPAASAAMQPMSTAATPEELDYWMKVRAEALGWELPDQSTQFVYRMMIGYILQLAANQSDPQLQSLLNRMALQLMVLMVQEEALQILKTGLTRLLPSQLDPLAVRVDPTTLGIGSTGSWSAELRARGEAWSFGLPTYLAGEFQNGGTLGFLLEQLLRGQAATPEQQAAITRMIGILRSTLQASLGSMQCTQLTCAVSAAPIEYGPVDVTGESYSAVSFAPASYVSLASGNRRALTGLAATPEGAPARMRVSTLASWFVGRSSAGEQAITVTARALSLSILRINGVAVAPNSTPVVGDQATFRVRIQAGEGEVCAIRFGTHASQAPTTPDAEPVRRFSPCLQPGASSEADIEVSLAARANGIYHAAFETTDGRGVQRWSPAVLIEVRRQAPPDQVPPSFSNLRRISNGQEVADGSIVATATLTLRGGVEDDVGVTALTYELNGDGPQAVPNALLGRSGAFDFNLTLRTGANSIVLRASDAAGNQASVTIRMTYSPPAISCDLAAPYTRRWTGGNGTSWSDAGNWSPAGVPGSADRLMICATAPNQPTLAASTTIAEILVQPGATLTINNAVTLNVAGNIAADGEIAGAGTVAMTGTGTVRGTLSNFQITSSGRTTLSPQAVVRGNLQVNGGGKLLMSRPEERLEVRGNASFNGSMSTAAGVFDLSAGTLLVGGDFLVNVTHGFRPGGTHRLVFNGSAPQTLTIYSSNPNYSYLHNVQMSNPAGVTVPYNLWVTGQLAMVGAGVLNAANIYYTSLLPQTSSGYRVTNTRVAQPLKLTRNVELLDAGNTLVVENTGVLELDGYTLTIGGNLQVIGTGKLLMNNADDRLEVRGNASFSGSMSTVANEFDLSAGTLLVGGNFSTSTIYAYRPGGSHITVFNGAQVQSITIPSGAANTSYLHNVQIENAAGVRFTSIHVAGVVEVTVGSELLIASGTTFIRQLNLRAEATLEIIGTLTCGNAMSRAKTAVVTGTGSNYCYNRLLNQRGIIIRLTWEGVSPYDLDAYLTGPRTSGGRFAVNKDNPSYTSATTVHAQYLFDDRIGFGPMQPDTEGEEFARFYPNAFPDAALQGPDGVFRFSVHDFTNRAQSGSQMLSQSRARVVVMSGFGTTGTVLATFDVPTGRAGHLWHVFEMRVDNIDPQNPVYTITPIQQVLDGNPPTNPERTVGTATLRNDPPISNRWQPDSALFGFRDDRAAREGREYPISATARDVRAAPARPVPFWQSTNPRGRS